MSLDRASERKQDTMQSLSNRHRYSIALVVIAIFSAFTLTKSIEETTELAFEDDGEFVDEDNTDYGWDEVNDGATYEETAYGGDESGENVFTGVEDKDPYEDNDPYAETYEYDQVDYATEADVESDTSEASTPVNDQETSSPVAETVESAPNAADS